MKKYIQIISFAFLFLGCGRHEPAFIVNNTGQNLQVDLILNNDSPDGTKLLSYMTVKSTLGEPYVAIGDCHPKFIDSLNLLRISIGKDRKLELETIPVNCSRDNIKNWEFIKIHAVADSFEVKASGNGIMSMVNKKNKWLGYSYYLVIGNQSKR